MGARFFIALHIKRLSRNREGLRDSCRICFVAR